MQQNETAPVKTTNEAQEKAAVLLNEALQAQGFTGLAAILTKTDGSYSMLKLGKFIEDPLLVLGAADLMKVMTQNQLVSKPKA